MINGIIKLFYTEVVKTKMKNLPSEQYKINDQFKNVQEVSIKVDMIIFNILKLLAAIMILIISSKINVYFGIGMFFVEFAYVFYKKSLKTKVKSEIKNLKTNIYNCQQQFLKEKGKKDISFLISILLLGLITGFTWVVNLSFCLVFIITIRDIYVNYKSI